MSKKITISQAVELIEDNQTVAILGSGGGVCEPTSLLKGLGKRFEETNTPRNLTLYHCNGIGDKDTFGTDSLAYEGLVKRDIAGHWAMAPKMAQLALDNKIEAYNFPQGVLSQMYQAVASKSPGVITKTGLKTFVDPRIEGGKMNALAKEDLVKLIKLEGEEWLFYPRLEFNVGLVRGTTIDKNGNISFEEEPAILEAVSLCQAVKNSGGIVIAQVKYESIDALKAKAVVIPGIYVDYYVVDSNQWQTCDRFYDPSLTGNIRTPFESVPTLPLDHRKVIARRAMQELSENDIINLGVGMPSGIASVVAETGELDKITFTVEQGLIGGMPMGGIIFGVSHNPEAMIDQTLEFNFYDGGGLDEAFLGMAQIDDIGNVNSSKTGKMLAGCGGAINISQNAKKVIFCGTFTAKKLKTEIKDGQISILHEGEIRKFVNSVDQITFSGEYSNSINQPVLYITERAVFERQDNHLVLKEIAPGIDLEKDILAKMDFKPEISSDLKIMDQSLFI